MDLGIDEMGKTAPCFGAGGASSEEMDEGLSGENVDHQIIRQGTMNGSSDLHRWPQD